MPSSKKTIVDRLVDLRQTCARLAPFARPPVDYSAFVGMETRSVTARFKVLEPNLKFLTKKKQHIPSFRTKHGEKKEKRKTFRIIFGKF